LAGEQKELKTLTVEPEQTGVRLDVFITSGLVAFSRSKVQRLIKQGEVAINGEAVKSSSYQLTEGEVVTVAGTTIKRDEHLEPIKMDLDILFEDNEIIVINKPPGISVHPGAGTNGPTLVQGLLWHCQRLGVGTDQEAARVRPGIVHRLDKDTTGILICAKTDESHAAMSKQFHDKNRLVREYAALLDGVMSKAELVRESYLYRDAVSRQRFVSSHIDKLPGHLPPGSYRYAKSVFSAMAIYGGRLTVARVRLFTGRTHQIRVHAGDLGLPIIGDQLYHRPVALPHKFPEELRTLIFEQSHQLLHARRLEFDHPKTGARMEVKAPFPNDFSRILSLLEPFRSAQ